MPITCIFEDGEISVWEKEGKHVLIEVKDGRVKWVELDWSEVSGNKNR